MSFESFNKSKVDHLKEPMFFGQNVNIARYDTVAHPKLDKLTETQLGFFWRPEEIDISQDTKDFSSLSDAEKHIFTSNLKRQILLDSVQGRSPNVAFLPYVSIPELETWIATWAFSETIHSRSYTHIIRNIYPNPSEVFDSIMDNSIILNDASQVTKYYDDFINYAQRVSLHGFGKHEGIKYTEKDLNTKLLLALASVNCLEGVRFYVSFVCAWAFAESSKMVGNADIISLISRDEALHLVGTQYMLLEAQKENPYYWDLVKEEIKQIYIDAANSEKAWAEYLFKDGSMIGLNTKILSQFIEYITNKRLEGIGLEPVFPIQTRNPMRWVDQYLFTNGVQSAPQEKEITKYVGGAIQPEADIIHKLNLSLEILS